MYLENRAVELRTQIETLQKSRWRWRDICNYYGCASAKANEIRKKALENGGQIDYDRHAVQSRKVLEMDGTTPEAEIKKRLIELNAIESQLKQAPNTGVKEMENKQGKENENGNFAEIAS